MIDITQKPEFTSKYKKSLAELNADKAVPMPAAYYDIIDILDYYREYCEIDDDKRHKMVDTICDELKDRDVALIDFYRHPAFQKLGTPPKNTYVTGVWGETREGYFPSQPLERWNPKEGKKMIIVWFELNSVLAEQIFHIPDSAFIAPTGDR